MADSRWLDRARAWRPPRIVRIKDASLIVPGDMAWAFRGGSYYESHVVDLFCDVVARTQDPVVYDVGANIGTFALPAASKAAVVYAFEPASQVVRQLERNLRRNGRFNVRVFPVALGSEEEERELFLYSSSGNNSLFPRQLPRGHLLRLRGKERVRVTTLDRFVAAEGARPPTTVKIDVEGAELMVLRGARSTLRSVRPTIFLEFSNETLRDAGYPPEDVVEELRSLGLELFSVGRDPEGRPAVKDLESSREGSWDTLLAIAPERIAVLLKS